jgi:hypothetical protein
MGKKPKKQKREPPVHIPLPFEQAVEALLQVKPKGHAAEEHLRRNYLKEEEFIDEYGNAAYKAAEFLAGEWRPDPDCNDNTRKQREYFLNSGESSDLAFESAAVYHDKQNLFSSAQIVLRSPKRTVTVRVRVVGRDLVAEKVGDRTV